MDIRGAFDFVHIPTLISYLSSLDLPPDFCNLIRSLFTCRSLSFSSPFGSHNTRSAFIGLPQGSCLSPILFNIYINFIAKHLSSRGHQFLIYADDIVIFPTNKSLNLAIEALNTALIYRSQRLLNRYFFTIAPEKCKPVIFTRRRYLHPPSVSLGNNIIPFVPDVTYLGLTLDPKLRWAPHIASLSKFLVHWSNFLRSVAGTWRGSHPSTLLSIYFSIIRSKLDHGCFLFGSCVILRL